MSLEDEFDNEAGSDLTRKIRDSKVFLAAKISGDNPSMATSLLASILTNISKDHLIPTNVIARDPRRSLARCPFGGINCVHSHHWE